MGTPWSLRAINGRRTVDPIDTVEEWNVTCGENAAKDMLFVVEVYAAWCGPSQAVLSTYKKIKDNNEAKKFKLCKVCADLCPDSSTDAFKEAEETPLLLAKHKVNPRPTFLLFKEGELVAQVEGVSMPTLEKLITEHMPEGLLEEEEVVAEEENEEEN